MVVDTHGMVYYHRDAVLQPAAPTTQIQIPASPPRRIISPRLSPQAPSQVDFQCPLQSSPLERVSSGSSTLPLRQLSSREKTWNDLFRRAKKDTPRAEDALTDEKSLPIVEDAFPSRKTENLFYNAPEEQTEKSEVPLEDDLLTLLKRPRKDQPAVGVKPVAEKKDEKDKTNTQNAEDRKEEKAQKSAPTLPSPKPSGPKLGSGTARPGASTPRPKQEKTPAPAPISPPRRPVQKEKTPEPVLTPSETVSSPKPEPPTGAQSPITADPANRLPDSLIELNATIAQLENVEVGLKAELESLNRTIAFVRQPGSPHLKYLPELEDRLKQINEKIRTCSRNSQVAKDKVVEIAKVERDANAARFGSASSRSEWQTVHSGKKQNKAEGRLQAAQNRSQSEKQGEMLLRTTSEQSKRYMERKVLYLTNLRRTGSLEEYQAACAKAFQPYTGSKRESNQGKSAFGLSICYLEVQAAQFTARHRKANPHAPRTTATIPLGCPYKYLPDGHPEKCPNKHLAKELSHAAKMLISTCDNEQYVGSLDDWINEATRRWDFFGEEQWYEYFEQYQEIEARVAAKHLHAQSRLDAIDRAAASQTSRPEGASLPSGPALHPMLTRLINEDATRPAPVAPALPEGPDGVHYNAPVQEKPLSQHAAKATQKAMAKAQKELDARLRIDHPNATQVTVARLGAEG